MIYSKYKKIIAAIASAFIIGNSFAVPSSQASAVGENSSSSSKSSQTQMMIQSIMGVAGVGVPISGTVNYNWMSDDERGQYAAVPICYGTKAPTVDESASYYCAIVDMKSQGVKGFVSVSGDVDGGKQTLSGQGQYNYEVKKVDSDGNETTEQKTGHMVVNVNINGYEGKTSVSDSSSTPYQYYDTTADTGSSSFTSGGTTDGETTTTNYGDSLCPDGTYYCSSDDITSTLPTDSTSTNSTTDTSSSGSNGYSNGTTSSSDSTDYSDLINDLLNDAASSFNSGNSDWADSSSGNEGDSNLDDYFNGLGEDSETLPTDMTDDILGVGDEMLADMPVDTDGDGEIDSMQTVDGDVVPIADYMSGNYDKSTLGRNGGYYSDGDYSDSTSPDTYNSGMTLQDFLGALDGFNDAEGNSSLGGLNEDGSLSSRINSLLTSKTDTASGNGDQSVSEQTMYDLAKKLLLSNGMSLDDITKGKNYDKNSAYTEPVNAWDMNRITTLIKNKKIKTEGSDAIRKTDNKNSLSGASSKSKEITDKSKSGTNDAKNAQTK